MKNPIILVAIFLLSNTFSYAQKVVKSTLTDATVYTQGAMLSHTASIVAEKGSQVVQVSGVSNNIDASSILVSLPSTSHLVSISTKVVSSEKKNMSYEEQLLVDSFQDLTDKQQDLNNLIQTEQFAVGLVKKNDMIFSSKENTTTDVVKAYTEYKKLLNDSHENIQSAQRSLEGINNKLELLKAEITDRGIWTKNKTVLELALQNDAAGTQKVNISYYTPNCRWVPSYHISNKDAQPSIDLEYKASIMQNTGFDWNDVHLSISTGNPQKSNLQPTITAWFLKYYVPVYNENGSVGYANSGNRIQSYDSEMDKAMSQVAESKALNTSTNNLIATNVFEINTPYDVKSGNLAVLAHIKTYTIPATIYFYCVPKLDKEVYMLASFTLEQSAELLPGEALIMSSGDFVGKTNLDPYMISDTMKLSLGRTPAVQVKRETIKASCKTSTIGNKTTTTRFYNFDIYNGLQREIRLVVKDNVPIATDKTMEVSVKELSRGELKEDSKIVTWDFEMAPRAKKEFAFGYEVKHLKDRTIPGL